MPPSSALRNVISFECQLNIYLWQYIIASSCTYISLSNMSHIIASCCVARIILYKSHPAAVDCCWMVGLLQRSKVTRHLDTFTASICWFTKRIYTADLKGRGKTTTTAAAHCCCCWATHKTKRKS
jgi:hypothetical protein